MTLKEMKELLASTGIPVAYRAWPVNDAPALPFICYMTTGSNNFLADGSVYHNVNRFTVELYTPKKDITTEEKLEYALSGICWEKTEDYIDSEGCYQISYEMEA